MKKGEDADIFLFLVLKFRKRRKGGENEKTWGRENEFQQKI